MSLFFSPFVICKDSNLTKGEKNIEEIKSSKNNFKEKGERFLFIIGKSIFRKDNASNSDLLHFLKRWIKKVSLFILLLVFTLSPIYFYKQNEEKKRFLTTTRLSVMDKEVQRACNYIEKNFADPNLNKESLCKALITGEAFLDALFLKELGISIEEFINYVRINRAKFFIQQDKNIGIETLAQKCGFLDSNNLIVVFEKITGKKIEEYKTQTLS